MTAPRPLEGRISIHPRGFGFLTAHDDGDVVTAFVPPPALNPFLEGDLVRAKVTTAPDGRSTASELTLLERTRTTVFGEVVSHRGAWFVKVDRSVSNTDWPLHTGEHRLEPGQWVVAKVSPDGEATVDRVLAKGGDVSLQRVMARYNLLEAFGPAALAGSAKAATIPHALGARRDLRDVPTVTVDAPSTRDIDDAIGVLPAGDDGALRLLVSIADASAFVPEGSPLDAEARERATSVYLAGRVLPMLPDALSSDWISLLPGEDRLCLTVELRIDPEGEVLATDVYESVIRSWARLDYTETAAFLDRGELSPRMGRLRDAMPWFRAASARLAVARARRGGVLLSRDEARVTFDRDKETPTGIERVTTNSAHTMIERFMVAANEAVATWLDARGVPAPFRVHDAPDPERVKDLSAFAHHFGIASGFGRRLTPLALAGFDAQIAGLPAEQAVRSVLRGVLGPARYTARPSLHFGLAAPLYLHFTSPIRRYADLAVHRLVKRYLGGERAFEAGETTTEALASHINERARLAGRAEAERHRMLEAEYMAKHVGEIHPARVTRIRPFGLLVQLDGSGAEGLVPFESLTGGPFRLDARETEASSQARRFVIGMPLTVKVVGADPALGRVEMALAEEAGERGGGGAGEAANAIS
jgi:ribonuclease R